MVCFVQWHHLGFNWIRACIRNVPSYWMFVSQCDCDKRSGKHGDQNGVYILCHLLRVCTHRSQHVRKQPLGQSAVHVRCIQHNDHLLPFALRGGWGTQFAHLYEQRVGQLDSTAAASTAAASAQPASTSPRGSYEHRVHASEHVHHPLSAPVCNSAGSG